MKTLTSHARCSKYNNIYTVLCYETESAIYISLAIFSDKSGVTHGMHALFHMRSNCNIHTYIICAAKR